jgi:hypothetical protein
MPHICFRRPPHSDWNGDSGSRAPSLEVNELDPLIWALGLCAVSRGLHARPNQVITLSMSVFMNGCDQVRQRDSSYRARQPCMMESADRGVSGEVECVKSRF